MLHTKALKSINAKLLGTQSVIEQQFFPEQVNLSTEIAGADLLSLAEFEVQPESKIPNDWDRKQYLCPKLLRALDGGYSELSAYADTLGRKILSPSPGSSLLGPGVPFVSVS